jgi:hypothetical protein
MKTRTGKPKPSAQVKFLTRVTSFCESPGKIYNRKHDTVSLAGLIAKRQVSAEEVLEAAIGRAE